MKLQVRADQYAFRLYRPGGELPETLPEHKLEGHRCVGHYTTLRALVKGARELLAKGLSKKAKDFTMYLDEILEAEDRITRDLEDLADAAMKLEVRPAVSSPRLLNTAIQTAFVRQQQQALVDEARASARLDGETQS